VGIEGNRDWGWRETGTGDRGDQGIDHRWDQGLGIEGTRDWDRGDQGIDHRGDH
jgi:hypothetical protein